MSRGIAVILGIVLILILPINDALQSTNMKPFLALSNLLLLSSGANFAASFVIGNARQHGSLHSELSLEQRSSITLGARKKAVSDDEDGEGDKSKMDPAKRAALQGVLTQIERNYGRGSVVRLGDGALQYRTG